MNYEEEKRRYISYCGAYCHQCDWHTGKIRRIARSTLALLNEYGGFKRLFEGKVDGNVVTEGLRILAESSICSGCKAETGANDRCAIRRCCSIKGIDLCSECAEFACETLKTNPGVIKFHCIENLNQIKEIGLKTWVDKQWSEYTR